MHFSGKTLVFDWCASELKPAGTAVRDDQFSRSDRCSAASRELAVYEMRE